MNDLELIRHGTDLDFELSTLLDEPPRRFIITHVNGKECPMFGTPYDSEQARKNEQYICDRLNDKSDASWWPDIFDKRKREWCKHYDLAPETTHTEFHPHFSLKLCDTVHGYTKHHHVAFGIFEKLTGRVDKWEIVQEGLHFAVRIRVGGKLYKGKGTHFVDVVCDTAVRALRSMQNVKTVGPVGADE